MTPPTGRPLPFPSGASPLPIPSPPALPPHPPLPPGAGGPGARGPGGAGSTGPAPGWRGLPARLARRLNRVPLRARLAALTAAAVALAVAACAVAAWFIVRDQLNERLDESLATYDISPRQLQNQLTACSGGVEVPSPPSPVTVQIVTAEGDSCVGANMIPVRVTDSDLTVAAEGPRAELGPYTPEPGEFRQGTSADGTETMRVLVRPLGGGGALLIAQSTASMEAALDNLVRLLALAAGAGAGVAAVLGLLVARGALAPVHRLTGAIEYLTRTGDLRTRVPVEGDDEVARLSRSFNAMTTALDASRARERDLVADAGHELRTPLTSLRANVDLLLRSERTGRTLPTEQRVRLLDQVKEQLVEMSTLVGDLLELSRPEGERHSTPVKVVPLHSTVEQAVRRARLRGSGITIDTDLGHWYVRSDPAMLERAVLNLLDNAVKFSPPGGRVEVRLRHGELTVRDHGIGIDPADAPHVFERFWRSPSARGLPGSGLGLSIVAQVVRDAGGTVALAPADDGGGGTVATVRLPGWATGGDADAATATGATGVSGAPGLPRATGVPGVLGVPGVPGGERDRRVPDGPVTPIRAVTPARPPQPARRPGPADGRGEGTGDGAAEEPPRS
ncbi:sensor histidine kinase [Allostreptomyces psammosilenae]|uniref:histidine kinase n=1 Tax=Allostreptomyces psammosilenae TaxID=1892865 RepID=A0A852ZY37_9ACTN|nr:HAMP domain-containing sensor histidine kinase [Allostreptomyces psammosilenae]NYI03192.1 two-component system sensor histidine kinase MprB [Allostreptomyces psammosilenae]